MENISQHIEALVFTADQPVSEEEIGEALHQVYGFDISADEISGYMEEIRQRYQPGQFAIELLEKGGGWQFLTKETYNPTVAGFYQHKNKKKLSNAAIETLAIIAYKQPVTKSEVEQIRGVNCDYSIQKLLDKELIVITGRNESPGKPLLYGTSQLFMDYFGINSLDELPKLKELYPQDNQIGIPQEEPES